MEKRNLYIINKKQDSKKTPALTQIFNICAEEMIDDEQVQRILRPVISMIRAGVFDKKRQGETSKSGR